MTFALSDRMLMCRVFALMHDVWCFCFCFAKIDLLRERTIIYCCCSNNILHWSQGRDMEFVSNHQLCLSHFPANRKNQLFYERQHECLSGGGTCILNVKMSNTRKHTVHMCVVFKCTGALSASGNSPPRCPWNNPHHLHFGGKLICIVAQLMPADCDVNAHVHRHKSTRWFVQFLQLLQVCSRW